MCDTLSGPFGGGQLFAKNSDRPEAEVQLVEAFPRRDGGGRLRTQYLDIPDTGAAAVLGSRPAWLWGLEHGVNEYGVAVGNEKLWTADDPRAAPAALIGMDLVRLALERGRDAADAVEVITDLLARYGQGGDCDESGDRYFSSFLVADPRETWVLETSGRRWAARRTLDGSAISNRFTIARDWERGTGLTPGADAAAELAHPDVPTAQADHRLAASSSALRAGLEPVRTARLLRDHGDGAGAATPPPADVGADFRGITVCMHVPGYLATASGMIVELLPGRSRFRGWAAPGSPCVSVFLPVLAPATAPAALADPAVWARVRALRLRVESDGNRLAEVRGVLDPVEAELWRSAADVADDLPGWEALCRAADGAFRSALDQLRV